jgi:hypothetical protein
MLIHGSQSAVRRAAHAISRFLPHLHGPNARPTRVLALGLAILLLSASASVVPALAASRPTVYYMATNGSDAAAGSKTRPWATLYAALRKLRPGDTLYIRGGAYRYSGIHYTSLAGTAGHRILIAAYPGESPVFTGTSAPADFLYFDGNSAYITLRGFRVVGGGRVTGTQGSSVLGFTDNANHIRIEHMHLYGSPTWTLDQHLAYVASRSVNDLTFTGNIFDGRGCKCSGLLQFYHDPNAARITVTGNTFTRADQGVMIWANVSGLRISSNTFSYVRIAVRHYRSGGTTITGNRGSHVTIGVYADSKAHLTMSGNRW